jgi:acyl carrier protein
MRNAISSILKGNDNMLRDEIKLKIRDFLSRQFDGFDEFEDEDNLVDMGIVTEDFVFSLIQFLENEFNITISGEDFYKNNLSITSIGKFIEMQQKKKMKGKSDLIFEIKMCIVKIMGTQVLPIEVEFLEKLPYWNDEFEAEFKEQFVERFNIDMDLTKLKPLTFDKIADCIKQKQEQPADLNRSGSDLKGEPEETGTLDLPFLKLVIG